MQRLEYLQEDSTRFLWDIAKEAQTDKRTGAETGPFDRSSTRTAEQ